MGEPLTNTKQVTLELRSGLTVSVLVSKDDLKIRFQSNSASALQLILIETCERLTSKGYAVSSQEKAPSVMLLDAIDRHFAYRQKIK